MILTGKIETDGKGNPRQINIRPFPGQKEEKMDGQNFENENNVTVDTTATEVSSAAETVQETPVTEQPVNNYQDYTANVQPQAAATAPVQQPENKENNVLTHCQYGTEHPFHRTWMLHRMDRRTVWNRWYHLRSICQQAGQDRPCKAAD